MSDTIKRREALATRRTWFLDGLHRDERRAGATTTRKDTDMAEARAFSADTLAPWAEIVSPSKPATVDDLLTLPDDGWRYEVVEGVLVRGAGGGKRATTIAFNLGAELRAYVRPRRLGVVTGADGVYTFPRRRRHA